MTSMGILIICHDLVTTCDIKEHIMISNLDEES